MNTNDINCAHACRNTCAMLKSAIAHERDLSMFYEELRAVCDFPDVHAFLMEFSDQHRRMIEQLEEKLRQLEAHGQALDGVIASFDPAGV
jgi:rubrerythrin